MSLVFRTYRADDDDQLTEMIEKGLYTEDPQGQPINRDKIERTVQKLQRYPELGRFMIFELDNQVVGYSLLIHFWSNEYGGIVLTIDELFVKPAYRSHGIATRFITEYCMRVGGEVVALHLQSSQANDRAASLYKRLGFKQDNSSYFYLLIAESN